VGSAGAGGYVGGQGLGVRYSKDISRAYKPAGVREHGGTLLGFR